MTRALVVTVALLLLPEGSNVFSARVVEGQSRAAPRPGNEPSLILHGMSVIDGTGAPASENAWIRIDGNRIADVGRGTPPAARGARVLDLKGRTVIPGLTDMHAHLGPLPQARWMLKLQFAHGVTNVKSAGDSLGNLAALQRWMATDTAVPHLYVSGATINGNAEAQTFLLEGAETRARLQANKAFGVQFIKIHNWVSSGALRQIAEFCKANDLDLTGHVPLGISSVAAIDAGMTILEHVRLRASEVMDDQEIVARYPMDYDVRWRELFWARFDPRGRNIEDTLEALVARKDRFFLDPTLVIGEGGANYYDPAYEQAPVWQFVSPAMKATWAAAPIRRDGQTPEQATEAKQALARRVTFVGLAHARGIRLLTGTDTPEPYTIPGVSLLRELELFVEGGLTPVEAIRASTGMAATAFRNTTRGTIAAGQDADLVVVRGDVVSDIHAIRHIELVILGGQVHERQRLLDEAATLAGEHRADGTRP